MVAITILICLLVQFVVKIQSSSDVLDYANETIENFNDALQAAAVIGQFEQQVYQIALLDLDVFRNDMDLLQVDAEFDISNLNETKACKRTVLMLLHSYKRPILAKVDDCFDDHKENNKNVADSGKTATKESIIQLHTLKEKLDNCMDDECSELYERLKSVIQAVEKEIQKSMEAQEQLIINFEECLLKNRQEYQSTIFNVLTWYDCSQIKPFADC